MHTVDIYVDGSYLHNIKKYSYGVIVIEDGTPTYCLYGFGSDSSMAKMRNVAGEILGAQMAMGFALDHNMLDINMYYDYMGIECWAKGTWKTNKEGTIRYRAFYDQMISKGLNIKFHKVEAHTGVKYNEWADQAANKVWEIEAGVVKNSNSGHYLFSLPCDEINFK